MFFAGLVKVVMFYMKTNYILNILIIFGFKVLCSYWTNYLV